MSSDPCSAKHREKVEDQRQAYEKIFRRIGKFKKYMHDMCHLISNHAVKVANLRDKNDEVAKCLDDFTKIEEFSTTSKLSMAVAAELIATVGDHQDLVVQRVETLVLPNLSSYARICECIKADVWNAIEAIRREKRRRKSVKALNKKSFDPKSKNTLNDAHRELERASAETARLCQLCEEHVLKFEHKRLIDLKESLGTFVKIQIAAATKSLELLSETYKQIQSIDENEDLEILKASLNIGQIRKEKQTSSKRKDKKSQNSRDTSTKSSSQTLKDKKKGKNSKEKEASDSEYSSNDSFHSDVVRNLENVLRSNREVHKHKEKKERLRNSQDNIRGEKSRQPYSYQDSKVGRSTEEHRKDGRSSLDNSRTALKESSKSRRETTFSDEESLSVAPKMLGKRPSTPPRPITVPTRKSSTEDISSRYDDIGFNNNTRRPSNQNMIDAYYYSQSEDDRRKKYNVGGVVSNISNNSLKDSKRVSFQDTSINRSNMSPRASGCRGESGGVITSRYNEPERRVLNISGGATKQPQRNYC